jgi:hypothetical protein
VVSARSSAGRRWRQGSAYAADFIAKKQAFGNWTKLSPFPIARPRSV